MGLSHRITADYIKHTNIQAVLQADRTRFMFSGDQRTELKRIIVCVCLVYYQSLHGLDMRGVDGKGLFIPAFGLVYVAPQLGYLPPHVQHVVGCGEEIGGFLRAGCGLGGLGHSRVHLSCRRGTHRTGEIANMTPFFFFFVIPKCASCSSVKHQYPC